jgi:flavin reductase (DIM6/NTAB) family NADH-FMN oxidoreductase RutF
MSDPKENPGLARALGRVPSGLFIVTVRAGDRTNAFLASWVQQASFDPPTVSIAIKDGRPASELLHDGAACAVNVIPKDDGGGLMKHFGKGFGPDEDPFDGMETVLGTTGVELLPSALGALECKIRGSVAAGDHHVFVGEVVDGRSFTDEGESAVHLRKSGFHY